MELGTRDRDLPERTLDQAARQEVTSYREPLPPWTEWLTDRCKNITLPQTSFAGGKNLLSFLQGDLEVTYVERQ